MARLNLPIIALLGAFVFDPIIYSFGCQPAPFWSLINRRIQFSSILATKPRYRHHHPTRCVFAPKSNSNHEQVGYSCLKPRFRWKNNVWEKEKKKMERAKRGHGAPAQRLELQSGRRAKLSDDQRTVFHRGRLLKKFSRFWFFLLLLPYEKSYEFVWFPILALN